MVAREGWAPVIEHPDKPSVGERGQQDFSIGYLEHDTERVRLYIEESFTFLILTEQAAIPLSTAKTG